MQAYAAPLPSGPPNAHVVANQTRYEHLVHPIVPIFPTILPGYARGSFPSGTVADAVQGEAILTASDTGPRRACHAI